MNQKKTPDTVEEIQARIDKIANRYTANKTVQINPAPKNYILSCSKAPKHDGKKHKLPNVTPIQYTIPDEYFDHYKKQWEEMHPNQKWYDALHRHKSRK